MSETVRVMMCKLPFQTHLFNKGQKVWVKWKSGNLAYCVTGKHRGSGRYIHGWVNWRSPKRPCPEWVVIEVDAGFAARHGLLVCGESNLVRPLLDTADPSL